MKAYVHLWYLAEFFLEWEMFNINVVQKIKTHNLSTVTFFPNVMAFMIYVCVCVWEREREISTAGQPTGDKTVRRRKDTISVPDN